MTRHRDGAAGAARPPWSILHVDSERTWRGGERQVMELMRRQRRRGHTPHLAAPGASAIAARAGAEGFPVHAVPMRGTWDVFSALAIAGLHRRLRPDIVHWHAARAHALGAMASVFAPGPARVLSRRVDFPVRRTPGSKLLWALPVEGIAAISDGVRTALEGSGVDPARVRVVPSGIDLTPHEAPFDRAALRARYGIGDEEIVALQVAALAPHKAQSDLLRAAALARGRAPSLRIWIAGEGPLGPALEAEQRELGLGTTVRFLGFREDVIDLLRAADFFVVSSYLEGMGTATLDAMAAGLPVAATRVGGVPEIVQDGQTGLLVPPRDPTALSEAMTRLALDRELRARLGNGGKIKVLAFSADQTEERTDALYAEILTRREGPTRPRVEDAGSAP